MIRQVKILNPPFNDIPLNSEVVFFGAGAHAGQCKAYFKKREQI